VRGRAHGSSWWVYELYASLEKAAPCTEGRTFQKTTCRTLGSWYNTWNSFVSWPHNTSQLLGLRHRRYTVHQLGTGRRRSRASIAIGNVFEHTLDQPQRLRLRHGVYLLLVEAALRRLALYFVRYLPLPNLPRLQSNPMGISVSFSHSVL
jgi:hypothetical protein